MSADVAVLTLGGTISMTGDAGVEPTLGAEELIEAVPQLRDGPSLVARSLMRMPGANLTFAHLDEVAASIRSELSDAVGGVVVVQGTDTIEETAFALDVLLAHVDAPIVVTGAMRNPTLAGPDGPANLFAAVRCVASGQLDGLGVTVVMNDTVHSASRVQKRHASRTDAFSSFPHGPLGWFQEGQPIVLDRTRIRFETPAPERASVRVPILTATMDPDIESWRAVVESGIDGLVVAGMGVGHVPEALTPLLEVAAGRIPVVLATRTRGGSVHERTYGFVGSEQHLLAIGLVSAGWLDPIKARILTALTLRGPAPDVRNAFAPVNGDSSRRATGR
ncbi:MAG TPA: asparaginase [Acidimicrobiia bacterium]|jgi:L-asparaginase